MKHFCREASRLASDGYERDLSLIERIRLRLHLWMCRPCRNYHFNLSVLDRLMTNIRRHADEHAPCLSESERQRILQLLQQEERRDSRPDL